MGHPSRQRPMGMHVPLGLLTNGVRGKLLKIVTFNLT